MNNQMTKTDEYVEIDIQRIIGALWRKIWLVVLVAVLTAVFTFVGVFYFVDPEYESSTMFYVNNSDISVGSASLDISSADITASKDLVESYIVILRSRDTLTLVKEYLRLWSLARIPMRHTISQWQYKLFCQPELMILLTELKPIRSISPLIPGR